MPRAGRVGQGDGSGVGAGDGSDPGPSVRSAGEPELLRIAADQAVRAGGLLLERYRSGVAEHGVHAKSTPTDLVSDADIEAERTIREGIARLRPDDALLGEEGDDRPGTSGLRWVVDPLDGTVDFLFGIPHWCVSVAVQDEEFTIAGAVFDPLRGELFTATRGGEAWLESRGFGESSGLSGSGQGGAPDSGQGGAPGSGQGGAPGSEMGEARALKVSTRENLADAMIATGFNYDASVRARQAQVLLELLPKARDIRRFGAAALDLAWTAAGRFDAFYERGVHIWDVAAGVLLCERAGLSFRELPARDGLPWGVLVAPPGLVEELFGLVG
jgi:myo-inositol-1(or 4)-monophosphatase